MACKVQCCRNYNNSNDKDCILELLDIIKLHYFHLQTELKEKCSSIFALETENLSLNKTIDILRQQNQLDISTPVKRRKTNRSQHPDSTILSTSKIFPRAVLKLNDDSTTDLNAAINSDLIFDCSGDGTLSSSQIENNAKTFEKLTEERIPLSPIENQTGRNNEKIESPRKETIKKNSRTPVKLTPTKISDYLPKRLQTKETASGKVVIVNEINKIPLEPKNINQSSPKGSNMARTSSGWISCKKENSKKSPKSIYNQTLGFIQPVVSNFDKNENFDNSSESIASSQDNPQKPLTRKERIFPSLRLNPKLRQAKLEFDRKKLQGTNSENTQIVDDNKPDESICDDVVAASPGMKISSVTKEKPIILRSLRKFTRKNDDELFNLSLKKPLLSLQTTTTNRGGADTATGTTTTTTAASIQQQTSTPSFENEEMPRIKIEEETKKKSCVTRLFQSEPEIKKDENAPLITEDSISDLSSSDFEKSVDKPKVKNDDDSSGNASSVILLPSQPDDVIFIDETENFDLDDIDSMDLIKEIMKKVTQTQPLLKQIEKKQMSRNQKKHDESHISSASSHDLTNANVQSTNIKIEHISECEKTLDPDITQVSELDRKEIEEQIATKQVVTSSKSALIKIPITLKSIGHNCDCSDCCSFLKYLLTLDLTEDEIKSRIKTNSKHSEKPLKLHNTPEGFWDPVMRDFPPDDPRSKVLIDDRKINKDKIQEKRKRDFILDS